MMVEKRLRKDRHWAGERWKYIRIKRKKEKQLVRFFFVLDKLNNKNNI